MGSEVKQVLSELDIAELDHRPSIAMVKRYSRAYTSEDAARVKK